MSEKLACHMPLLGHRQLTPPTPPHLPPTAAARATCNLPQTRSEMHNYKAHCAQKLIRKVLRHKWVMESKSVRGRGGEREREIGRDGD